MRLSSLTRLFATAFLSLSLYAVQAQPAPAPAPREVKPYKVVTSGKQITIKSSKDISHVMLWTTNGNRVVEQREINNSNYTFRVPVDQKNFFMMVGLKDGKVFTQKLAL